MVILEKIIKFLIIMMYVVVYAYSARMTTVKPDEIVWGWICTILFGIGAIWLVSNIKDKKDVREEERNSGEEGVLHD
jgi:hypothetical protein